MRYKLCIEGENGQINIDDPNVIKRIDIHISQRDKSENSRSDQLFGDLVIQGVLNLKSQQATKEILEWSMKTDKASGCKTVYIQVYYQDKLLRDYYLKDMFCAGYKEVFDEYSEPTWQYPDSIGTFVLEMKQRKGSIETMVVPGETVGEMTENRRGCKQCCFICRHHNQFRQDGKEYGTQQVKKTGYRGWSRV